MGDRDLRSGIEAGGVLPDTRLLGVGEHTPPMIERDGDGTVVAPAASSLPAVPAQHERRHDKRDNHHHAQPDQARRADRLLG